MSVTIHHVDLASDLSSLDLADGHAHRLYLWWKARPLGVVDLEAWQLPVSRLLLARLVAMAVAPAVGDLLCPGGPFRAELPGDIAPVGEISWEKLLHPAVFDQLDAIVDLPTPPVEIRSTAIVVCTHNRPQELEACLRSLKDMTTPPTELVVVDNCPMLPDTKRVCEQEGVKYVAEDRLGLSHARNAGIAATSADVIAFTDDDVIVHADWLARLIAGFTSPDVMAVTGLILPRSLDTTAQRFFEQTVGGFGQGFRRREYDREWLMRHRRRTANVWQVGAGANTAFRRGAFDRVGMFDPRLGAGAAGCSEDSEIWYRLLAGGWTCRYEPSSVVFHNHRATLHDLQQQSRAYMRGHVAALAVQWARLRQVGEPRRAMIAIPKYYLRRGLRRLAGSGADHTLFPEVCGYGAGLARAVPLLRRGTLPLPRLRDGEGPVVKATLTEFLRTNPFPQRRSLGLFYGEKMRAIHQISPDRGVRRVAEVGGGQSGLAAALYPSAQVLTLDLDRSFGARRDLYGTPGHHFVCADATRLALAEHSVDVVTLFDVAEHLPDDHTALLEAVRVLRPGGSLLLTTPSPLWRFPYYKHYARFTPTDVDMMREWGHVRRGYSATELDRLVGRAHDAFATFITPLTVPAHDLAFSRLPTHAKRLAGAALTPFVFPAALLHAPWGPGTEIALRWTIQ